MSLRTASLPLIAGSMSENLFCKIFVLTSVTRDELTRFVAEEFHVSADGHNIEFEWGTMDVLNNDDADSSRTSGPDGFLYFPYLIETEPNTGFDRARFVGRIGTLLDSLWAAAYGAVAACGFEEELPRNGGFTA
jgi:hypothetical protein